MSKQFKTIKPISAKQNLWSTLDIPVGTILEQIPDTKNLIHPIKGIVVEYRNQTIGIPYEYLIPNYEHKTTILLFHGFNSAPENKQAVINQWLIDNNLSDCIDLIAPQLNYNPNEAIKQIGSIIQEHYGNIIVIGTSLGGFYANYVRAMNQTDQIKVHAINPSWSPSQSLKKEVNKAQVNLKTKDNWIFTDAHLNYLAHFEKSCKVELKHYNSTNYTLHLATADELLSFDDMISYINDNKIPNKLNFYDTNHRFETINELLENIKHELIP
ncbi:YqiA/YcfP family alpha/beta fold hydrolase [Flavobacterium chungnamense]|uniref:Esterase n=1 Tax=Flavobacterium chungnamense TaxID=706182 RepID=A0ABP7V4R6_9FLAO